jgi:hypothetical protein
MLGSLAEGEVLSLKGGETMVFRHNGRVETRKGGPRGAGTCRSLTLDRVEIFFPDTGPAPEFRLSQARQGSTTSSPPPG